MKKHCISALPDPHPFNPNYQKLKSVEVGDENGLLRQISEFVESDNLSISQFNSADFAFCNLIATGAFGGLKTTTMSLQNDMNFVDNFGQEFKQNESVSTPASIPQN